MFAVAFTFIIFGFISQSVYVGNVNLDPFNPSNGGVKSKLNLYTQFDPQSPTQTIVQQIGSDAKYNNKNDERRREENYDSNHQQKQNDCNNYTNLMQQNTQLLMQNQFLLEQNIVLQQKIEWLMRQSHSPFIQANPQAIPQAVPFQQNH